MTNWVASVSVPAGFPAASEQAGCLFQTEQWTSVLERGLGCDSIWMHDEDHARGAVVSRFRAGPFRIGYLGFPVGGIVARGSDGDAHIESMRGALSTAGIVAMRIPVSAFGPTVALDLPHESTPETAIVDLQSWSLAGITKNRRRDVNKSLRAGLELVDTTDPRDAASLYDLYRKTLQRNRGSLRYTERYFGALIRLAQTEPRLRVMLARLGDAIAAFTVVARHRGTAYYLHGAFDWEMREHIPSAMLLNEAIEWSKREGCGVFNLMSSPPGQETLVRYKELWGAETREHRTYTLPVKPTYPLFRAMERLYRAVR